MVLYSYCYNYTLGGPHLVVNGIGLQRKHSLFETHATPYCLKYQIVIVVECHYYVEMKLLWILYTNTEAKILIIIHEH